MFVTKKKFNQQVKRIDALYKLLEKDTKKKPKTTEHKCSWCKVTVRKKFKNGKYYKSCTACRNKYTK